MSDRRVVQMGRGTVFNEVMNLLLEHGRPLAWAEIIDILEQDQSLAHPAIVEKQVGETFPEFFECPGLSPPSGEATKEKVRNHRDIEALHLIQAATEASGLSCGVVFALLAYTPALLRHHLPAPSFEETWTALRYGADRKRVADFLDQATDLAGVPRLSGKVLAKLTEKQVKDIGRLLRHNCSIGNDHHPFTQMELARLWGSAMRGSDFMKDDRLTELKNILPAWGMIAQERLFPLTELVLNRRVAGDFYFQHAILAAIVLANNQCLGGFDGSLRVVCWCKSEEERMALKLVLSAYRIPNALFVGSSDAPVAIPATATMALLEAASDPMQNSTQQEMLTRQLLDRSRHRRYLILYLEDDLLAPAGGPWRRKLLDQDLIDATYRVEPQEGGAHELVILDNAKRSHDRGLVYSCLWRETLWHEIHTEQPEGESYDFNSEQERKHVARSQFEWEITERMGSILSRYRASIPTTQFTRLKDSGIGFMASYSTPGYALQQSVGVVDWREFVELGSLMGGWIARNESPASDLLNGSPDQYVELSPVGDRKELCMRPITQMDEGVVVEPPAIITDAVRANTFMLSTVPIVIGDGVVAGVLDVVKALPRYLEAEVRKPYFQAQREHYDGSVLECWLRLPSLKEQERILFEQDRSWGLLPRSAPLTRDARARLVDELMDNILAWAPQDRTMCTRNLSFILDALLRKERQDGLASAQASIHDVRHELGHLSAKMMNTLERIKLRTERPAAAPAPPTTTIPTELLSKLVDSTEQFAKDSRSLLDDVLRDLEEVQYEMTVFDPHAVIQEVIQENGGLTRVVFVDKTSPDWCYVRADRNKVKQILRGLVDNAVHHGLPDKGQMTVLFEMSRSEPLNEGDEIRDDTVTIFCANNGKPMELPRDQALRRGTRSAQSKGSGLGLSIARKWAKGMGGDFGTPGSSSTRSFIDPKNEHQLQVVFDIHLPQVTPPTRP